MPGFLVQVGATVMCAHAGQAQATVPSARVTLGGQPAVTMPPPWVVAGCALTGTPNPPCATATWLTGSTRITADGVPLLLADSQSTCVPTGTPLMIVVTQLRVKGI